jgi:hypothetical protein
MEIIIGRDQNTRQLSITKDGTNKTYGKPGSVPMSVSRHHISLQPVGVGKWHIKNLNERNVTLVNGIAVESKTISENDKVELGNDHYLFSWDALSEPKVETIDIRPLKKVWDDYKNKTSELNMATQKFNIARSATGIITMLAIACGFVIGHGPIYILFYGVAIALSLCFLYKAWTDVSRTQERRDEFQEEFDCKWVCPKCGRPLTAKNYIILSKLDECPYCHTKFKK